MAASIWESAKPASGLAGFVRMSVPTHTAELKAWYQKNQCRAVTLGCSALMRATIWMMTWDQLKKGSNTSMGTHITPLHDGEVGLAEHTQRRVGNCIMQRASKVWTVQEDDGLGDVEVQRKLLESAVQVALALVGRVGHGPLGVGVARG